jgi:hypothetical protein
MKSKKKEEKWPCILKIRVSVAVLANRFALLRQFPRAMNFMKSTPTYVWNARGILMSPSVQQYVRQIPVLNNLSEISIFRKKIK